MQTSIRLELVYICILWGGARVRRVCHIERTNERMNEAQSSCLFEAKQIDDEMSKMCYRERKREQANDYIKKYKKSKQQATYNPLIIE